MWHWNNYRVLAHKYKTTAPKFWDKALSLLHKDRTNLKFKWANHVTSQFAAYELCLVCADQQTLNMDKGFFFSDLVEIWICYSFLLDSIALCMISWGNQKAGFDYNIETIRSYLLCNS